MVGEKLTKALEWCSKGIMLEASGKENLMIRCIDKMVVLEEEALKEGESWD